jgi:hypothetical protein
VFAYPFNGPSEDDAHKPTIPAFLETEPDRFKQLEKCSRLEIEAQIMSRPGVTRLLHLHSRSDTRRARI